MPLCPFCGAEGAVAQRVCSVCGQALPAAGGNRMNKTMIGVAPMPGAAALTPPGSEVPSTLPGGTPLSKTPPRGTAATNPGGEAAGTLAPATLPSKKTMFGVAPDPQGASARDPAEPQTARTGAAAAAKRTLFGVAPPQGLGPSVGNSQGGTQIIGSPPVGGAPVGEAPLTSVSPPPQQLAAGPSGTMLGIPSPVAQASKGASQEASPKNDPPPLPGFIKTVLGVARPGIAPLHPGKQKALAMSQPLPVSEIPAPPPPTLRNPAWRIPRGALVLIAVCGVLVAGAGAIVLFYRGPKPLLASVGVNDKGQETLVLRCETCPDGTVVHHAGMSATFGKNEALLTLATPLSIGINSFAISIDRPGLGRDEEVTLDVPVQFRVRGDFSALKDEKPSLTVLIDAAPHTTAVIDGKAVVLDGSGIGRYSMDVESKLQGQEAGAKLLDTKIPYSITPQDGEPESGSVSLKIGIVPLTLEAPGPSTVLDNDRFMLAGRTVKGGTVTVSGKPITVDPAGRFQQLMSVDSVGETTITVRADAPDQAPRLALLKVKRVEDLRKEAELFRQTASDSYSAYAQNIDSKIGLAVVAEGYVEEARVDNQTTVVLLDVSVGCSKGPCLTRLIYGGKLNLKSHEKISAFGNLTRAVDGIRAGIKVPEIRVAFIVKGNAT